MGGFTISREYGKAHQAILDARHVATELVAAAHKAAPAVARGIANATDEFSGRKSPSFQAGIGVPQLALAGIAFAAGACADALEQKSPGELPESITKTPTGKDVGRLVTNQTTHTQVVALTEVNPAEKNPRKSLNCQMRAMSKGAEDVQHLAKQNQAGLVEVHLSDEGCDLTMGVNVLAPGDTLALLALHVPLEDAQAITVTPIAPESSGWGEVENDVNAAIGEFSHDPARMFMLSFAVGTSDDQNKALPTVTAVDGWALYATSIEKISPDIDRVDRTKIGDIAENEKVLVLHDPDSAPSW